MYYFEFLILLLCVSREMETLAPRESKIRTERSQSESSRTIRAFQLANKDRREALYSIGVVTTSHYYYELSEEFIVLIIL